MSLVADVSTAYLLVIQAATGSLLLAGRDPYIQPRFPASTGGPQECATVAAFARPNNFSVDGRFSPIPTPTPTPTPATNSHGRTVDLYRRCCLRGLRQPRCAR